MSNKKNDTGLTAIRIVGGFFSVSLFPLLRLSSLPGQSTKEYGVEKGLKLSDELGRYYRISQARWQEFRELSKRKDLVQHTVTVEHWLLPLLNRVFGFDITPVSSPQLQEKLFDFATPTTLPLRVGERLFPISHTAFGGAVPFLLVGSDCPLDKEDVRFGEEKRRRSPAGLIQEYLNANGEALWGIVSNGMTLRLLRDNPSITRPAFIEVDLELLFEDGLFADFTVCWLLLHGSRLAPRDLQPGECFLEQWRSQGQSDGERVLGQLRHGVKDALRTLGNGFVVHPGNKALRTAIQDGDLTPENFLQELLHLIYRMLFLFITEDRGVILDPSASLENRKLYQMGYSLGSLRDRARLRRHYDNHVDGWEQLLINFKGFATGQPRLGQPALGGLFASDQCPNLELSQLANNYLYDALFKLSFFETNKALSRINYRDLDTEELGSVYEALLELIPQIKFNGRWSFGFLGDDVDEVSGSGHARKLTGSYYTPDSLVQELINSALVPMINKRLAENPDNPRQALLEITICDPACGSGHFLLAAARRMAMELARIDAGTSQPTENDFHHALREVVRHCIYGVDLNPLAVNLCRTALWLEAIEPGRPLGFLDAHIQVGNSLLGLIDPKFLEKGIPDTAFKAIIDDDRDVVNALILSNRMYLNQMDLFKDHEIKFSACAGDLSVMPEESLAQVEEKRQTWLTLNQSNTCQDERLRADLFTAAFFAPKTRENTDNVPTNMELVACYQKEVISPGILNHVKILARKHRFFHWYLAFPEVFLKGGFDVLLGNPPWERIKLQEKEFFASRSREIAEAPNADARTKKIQLLATGNEPEQLLFHAFRDAKHAAEATSSFARGSNRFPLTGKGDINLYALFAENFSQAIKASGRAGVVVPTGIATDDTTKLFFGGITKCNSLVSLYDLENRKKMFPDVDSRQKFCLLTLGKPEEAAELAFYSSQVSQFKDKRRCFSLAAEDFALINPNTFTCPVFRSKRDAELTKKIYRTAPVLIREAREDLPEENPWGIRFQAMFHMSNDSNLFETVNYFQEKGFELAGSTWKDQDISYLPLFEAKMVHHYDHRWATYGRDCTTIRNCTLHEKQNLDYENLPRYWIDAWQVTLRSASAPKLVVTAARAEDDEALIKALAMWAAGHAIDHGDVETAEKLLEESVKELFDEELSDKAMAALQMAEEYPLTNLEYREMVKLFTDDMDPWPVTRKILVARQPAYLLGWRDITNATNERTVIAGVIPLSAVGDTFLLMFPNVEDKRKIACMLADQNSLVHDFVARQKIGGTHLKYHVKKQIATFSPDQYNDVDLSFIVPRVLELTYTSHSLKPFALDLGYDGEPFFFDPERRHLLRSELDAYYARLYDLDRNELCYILDPADVMGSDYPSETFRVLKNKEIKEFGEYRTRRMVLEAWDRLESGSLRDKE